MTLIKPLTLEIENAVWDKFKEKTPRTIRLNDAVAKLIAAEIKKREESENPSNT